MKLQKSHAALFLVIMAACCGAFAQETCDCVAQVQEIYRNLNSVAPAAQAHQVFYLDYSIETKLRKGENQAPKERIKAVYAANAVTVIGGSMEMYIDEQSSFTVLPKERKVTWARSTLGLGRDFRTTFVQNFQDSLFRYALQKYCSEVDWKGRKVQKAEMTLSAQGQKLLNIQSVVFWFSEREKQLIRVVISFAGGPILESDIEFIEMSFDYKGDFIPVNFRKAYMDNQNRLKGKYAGHTLLDIRKK